MPSTIPTELTILPRGGFWTSSSSCSFASLRRLTPSYTIFFIFFPLFLASTVPPGGFWGGKSVVACLWERSRKGRSNFIYFYFILFICFLFIIPRL
jgi:hypothetical protein